MTIQEKMLNKFYDNLFIFGSSRLCQFSHIIGKNIINFTDYGYWEFHEPIIKEIDYSHRLATRRLNRMSIEHRFKFIQTSYFNHDICIYCGADNGVDGISRVGFDCYYCGSN